MAVAVENKRITGRGQQGSPSAARRAGQARQGDARSIAASDDDPMQSLAEAVRRHQAESGLGAQLDAELDRLGALTQELSRQLSAPAAAPIESSPPPPRPAGRGTAREAWSAVVILVLFIVAGFAWTTGEIQSRQKQVWTLKALLQEKETALLSYQQQVKRLREDLAQSQAKLKSAEKKLAAGR